jgi:DNA-binding cell septation regulator SpoVG
MAPRSEPRRGGRLVRATRRAVAGPLLVASVAACAGSGSAVRPPAAPQPRDTRSASHDASRWTPQRGTGAWTYQVTTDASVSLAGDTAGQNVPVHTDATYAVALSGTAPPLTLTGMIDSVTVRRGSRIPAPPVERSPIASFHGIVDADGAVEQLVSDAVDTTMCPGGVDPLMGAVRGLFVRTPAELAAGSAWQDTVSTISCRERVPVTTTVVRAYRLDGSAYWQGVPALRVERTSTIVIQSAPQDSARLTVSGTGSGSATLLLDPGTGMLLESRGSSSASITVLTVGASLAFTQQATENITRLR